jgi:hypothetical protein
MKKVFMSILIAALMLTFSGCPVNTSIRYGVWIFAVATTGNPNPAIVELAVLQNGISVNPPLAYPGTYGKFGGTVTWQRSGSSISLLNDTMSSEFVYDGTIESSTTMSGTWQQMGNPAVGGTWSAEWDPDS